MADWRTEFATLKQFKRNAPIIQTYFDGFTKDARMLVACRGVSDDNLSYFKEWLTFLDSNIPRSKSDRYTDFFKNNLKNKKATQSTLSLKLLKTALSDIDSSWPKDIIILFDELQKFFPEFITHFTIPEQDLVRRSGCIYLIPSIKKDIIQKQINLYGTYFDNLYNIFADNGDFKLNEYKIRVEKAVGSDAKQNAVFSYGLDKEMLLNNLQMEILTLYRDEPSLTTSSGILIASIVRYIRFYPFQTQLQIKNGVTSIVTIGSDIFEKIADYIDAITDTDLSTRIDNPPAVTATPTMYTPIQKRLTFLLHVLQAISLARKEKPPPTGNINELFLDTFSAYVYEKKRIFYTYTLRRSMNVSFFSGKSWMTNTIFDALEQENVPFSNIITILKTPSMDLSSFAKIPTILNIFIKHNITIPP